MKSRSKKGEFKKCVKDANKKVKNSLSLLTDDERSRLLSLDLGGGELATISSAKYSELDQRTQDWIRDLWARNMESLMTHSHWGFDPEDKAQELGAATSRYLIASAHHPQDPEPELLGYSHYRYDMDEGDPVVYCYEMQTEPEFQRRGIGARFLHILHLFAQRTHMIKVIATILNANTQSESFFRRLGFTEDETCPSSFAADFMILSKPASASIPLPSPLKKVRFPVHPEEIQAD